MRVQLPFSVTTTKYGLLLVATRQVRNLFTFCPHFGVMRGLGNFDDNPHLYAPVKLQLIEGTEAEIARMQREWEFAARTNTRFIGRGPFVMREDYTADAAVPFIPMLGEASYTSESDLAEYEERTSPNQKWLH